MISKRPVEIPPSGQENEFPLSRGQEALWFLHKLSPQSVAYHLSTAVAIPDCIDLLALQRAFQQAADRHPMLRATFRESSGRPAQCIHPISEISFHAEEASDWSSEKLDNQLTEEIYRPFEPEQGPLWRVSVFLNAPSTTGRIVQDMGSRSDLAPGDNGTSNLVLLVIHHIISDMWSVATLMTEVIRLYQGEIEGTPPKLMPLRSSYRDYVQKEQERIEGPEAKASWEYWRGVLANTLPSLNLPGERTRPVSSRGRGAAQSIHLDRTLTGRLRNLAEKHQVKLYTVLLAAFQTFIHRYSGQEDILVGFPKAGRSRATAGVVGYFVNQTVVRSNFAEPLQFDELLRKVQKSLDEGTEHSWYPFSWLVHQLQPERDLAHSPLIQAVFSWQQAPRVVPREKAGAFVLGQTGQTIELDGLTVRSVQLPARVAPFDLVMLATESADGLTLALEYATDLFDPDTIARMLRCYRKLLESIAANDHRLVSELELLPETDRRKIVETWNETEADFPREACLQQLFEEQAERTPEIVAVACGEEKLSYGELNRRANQLAHLLKTQGIEPGDLVGVYLQPSIQMVIAILAILKAGGAYLPLDHNYPKERLRFILADAQPVLLLTNDTMRASIPEFSGKIYNLSERKQFSDKLSTNLKVAGTPDDLAYVIYTSGSTGQPKGVALAHRGVVNLLADFQRRKPIQSGDPCSWWTSPSFDVSVYEIFSPLLSGCSLMVIPEDLRLNSSGLMDWLSIHQIRSAYLPPFFIEDFANWLNNHPGQSQLRRLLVGVEPIPNNLLVQIQALLPNSVIINGYGPTEATICSTLYSVNLDSSIEGNTPIGKPVANTQVYLLDSSLKPVPIGVTGELYIGGVGLAKGYLNQPELTEKRFPPSPFQVGERLYRTGDLARYLPDGNLVFVGRADRQVKLHGLRIELGEIEAVLARHPQVKGAVVALVEQPGAGKNLVAYIVPIQQDSPTQEELRKYLSSQLPAAMVPTIYMMRDAFPLTTSGKVDRKALLSSTVSPKTSTVGHTTGLHHQEQLMKIWEQVLGIGSIGIQDNFFELGGDSIMSLQVVALASEAGLRLTPQDVFQAPTLAGLASLVKQTLPINTLEEVEPFDGDIPLTPIQHWFFEQDFPHPEHWNLSLLLTPAHRLDPVHLHAAVLALQEHHPALRLRFTASSEGWKQVYAITSPDVPFEVIDLSGIPDSERSQNLQLHIKEKQQSLNLNGGRLVRVVYFHYGADHLGRLLVVIHHLAVDGVSWRILLADLERAYRQHEAGLNIQLPSCTTAFHTWVQQLVTYAQSAEVMQEASYWKKAAEATFRSLPTDSDQSEQLNSKTNMEEATRTVRVSLGKAEAQVLVKDLPGAYQVESNEILLTALTLAMQRWTGEHSLWIDLEMHGRENVFPDVDLSRSVGWFTTLSPVQLTLRQGLTPSEAIHLIKNQLRAIPHHGLGFGVLRYLCNDAEVKEQLRGIQPVPVSFNYLGQLSQITNGGLFLAAEAANDQRNPESTRAHQIEVNAMILQGELVIDWNYNPQLHPRETVEQIAGLFIEELRRLLSDCQSTQAYPLTPMQQGMLFQSLYAQNPGTYIVQTVLTITGSIEHSAFEKAWQYLLERHPILRSSFQWQGRDQPMQIVQEDSALPLEMKDWRGVPTSKQDLHMEQLLTAERRRGFELSTPPLWRLTLIQLADDRYTIVFNHHHALLDGWSVAILLEEAFTCYQSLHQPQTWSLPPVKPYHEYIQWLQAQDVAAAKDYWKAELAGFVPTSWPGLPAVSSPMVGASRPAEKSETLPAQLTNELQAYARQNHLTLNTLMQAAWALLLSRYTQSEDVIFGITTAGRPAGLTGSLRTVGLFINTLPLRVRIPQTASILTWLQSVQDKVMNVQELGYYSLSQIQTWGGVSHTTHLFDTLLVFENYPHSQLLRSQPIGLRIDTVRSVEQAPYPLTVSIIPDQQLTIKLVYDPEQFDAGLICDIMMQFHQILKHVVTNPDQRVLSYADPDLSLETQKRRRDSAIGGNLQKMNPALSQEIRADGYSGRGVELDQRDSVTNTLETYLIRRWEKLLKVEGIGIHDNFFELGGDSLSGAVCAQRLQEFLGEPVSLAAVFEAPTVAELAKYLEQNYPHGVIQQFGETKAAARKVTVHENKAPLVPIQPHGTKTPLFCIHPAGGIVYPYYSLVPYLGKEQPLYGLQDPSLYDHQATPESIQSMASAYLQAVKELQPAGPYRFLGWSVGGVIALEMAQQLFMEGEPMPYLGIVDTPAPKSRSFGQQSSDKKVKKQLRSSLAATPRRIRSIRGATRPIARYIHSGLYMLANGSKPSSASSGRKPGIKEILGWARFDAWRNRLLQEAEVAQVISQDDSLPLIQMPAVQRILRLVRVHMQLARQYSAQSYPGHITFYRAEGSQSMHTGNPDPSLGWKELSKDGIDTHILPGSHVSFFTKPYVELLAKELRKSLDK